MVVYLVLLFEFSGRGESLIWVGYHSLGQLLAQIELESSAMTHIEDNSRPFRRSYDF